MLALDRPPEALLLAEQAWTGRQGDDIPTGECAKTALLLARILWVVKGPARDRARARRLAKDALDAYRELEDGEHVDETQRWLGTHAGL